MFWFCLFDFKSIFVSITVSHSGTVVKTKLRLASSQFLNCPEAGYRLGPPGPILAINPRLDTWRNTKWLEL